MRTMIGVAGIMAACLAWAPAQAEGVAKAPAAEPAGLVCPADHICASAPDTVVKALQDAGYKAELGKSKGTGNPKISSAASGYSYDLFFYGCSDGRNCDSLEFMVSFEKDSVNSAELANLWNKDERFATMSFDPEDGSLTIAYDVSTVGGLNRANFADVIDWWAGRLGRAKTFFDAHPAKPAGAGAK